MLKVGHDSITMLTLAQFTKPREITSPHEFCVASCVKNRITSIQVGAAIYPELVPFWSEISGKSTSKNFTPRNSKEPKLPNDHIFL
jgi:hypothetical protein